MHTETHSIMYTHTNHTVRRDKAKAMCVGEALEKCGAQTVGYLCSLPFRISHLKQNTTTSSSSCTHTITHTPCSPLREKHLLPLQCAEITVIRKERVGKQGMEREITSQDISLLMLGTGCSSTESPWSSRASLMHDHTQTRARTHTHANAAPEIIGWPRL